MEKADVALNSFLQDVNSDELQNETEKLILL